VTPFPDVRGDRVKGLRGRGAQALEGRKKVQVRKKLILLMYLNREGDKDGMN